MSRCEGIAAAFVVGIAEMPGVGGDGGSAMLVPCRLIIEGGERERNECRQHDHLDICGNWPPLPSLFDVTSTLGWRQELPPLSCLLNHHSTDASACIRKYMLLPSAQLRSCPHMHTSLLSSEVISTTTDWRKSRENGSFWWQPEWSLLKVVDPHISNAVYHFLATVSTTT